MDYQKLIIENFHTPENKQCLTTEFRRMIKSEELAKQIRESATKLFTECSHNSVLHERIWDGYLCSIALSPIGSEALAVSYGNMSALLFHLSKYQECIDNIEKALTITKSIPLKVKLLCRKAKCLSALGMTEKDYVFEKATSWLNKISDDDETKKDLIQIVNKAKIVLNKNKVKVKRTTSTEINSCNKNGILKKSKGKKNRRENSEFEHLSILAKKDKENLFNSITLNYNNEYGSHLIATKYIKPGEIIFVSKSYVSVQNFKKSQNFCNNCLNVVWSGIPCENCATCMFCSEKCQNEAMENFHKVECPIMQYLISGDSVLDYYMQASLRAIIMGIKEFGSISKLKDQISNIDNYLDSDRENYKYCHDSFLNLFGFKNIYVEPEILCDLSTACCRVVICLTKFTSFFDSDCKFDTIEDFLENDDTVFIATLLLRVAAIVLNNGSKVSEQGFFCKTYVDSSICPSIIPCCEKGLSINSISQFIQHSCDPNVKSIKISDCKVIYYALQPIYEGDMLIECYDSTFYESELAQRQETIYRILNRNCTCMACIEKWPALLVHDDEMTCMESLVKIVIDSREFNNQKERFYNLIKKHGLVHQNVLDELTKISEINYNYFGQPSVEYCATIHVLQYVFNELYGIKIDMSDKCKTKKYK